MARNTPQSQSLGTTNAQRPTPLPAAAAAAVKRAQAAGTVRVVRAPAGTVAPMPTESINWQPTAPDTYQSPLLAALAGSTPGDVPAPLDFMTQYGQANQAAQYQSPLTTLLGISPDAPAAALAATRAPLVPMAGTAAPVPAATPAPQSIPVQSVQTRAAAPASATAPASDYQNPLPAFRELPAAPSLMDMLAPPSRDKDAEKRRREVATKVALLGPALSLILGVPMQHALAQTPSMVTAALQGANEANDYEWQQRVLDYQMADRVNQENARRVQTKYAGDVAATKEYNDGLREAARLQSDNLTRRQQEDHFQQQQERLNNSLDIRKDTATATRINTTLKRLAEVPAAQQEQYIKQDKEAQALGIEPQYDEQGRFIPYTTISGQVKQQNANTSALNAKTGAERAKWLKSQGEQSLQIRWKQLDEQIRNHNLQDSDRDDMRAIVQERQDLAEELGRRRAEQSDTRISIARQRAEQTATARTPQAKTYALRKEIMTLEKNKAQAMNPTLITTEAENAIPGEKEKRGREIDYYTTRLTAARAELARIESASKPAVKSVQTPIGRVDNSAPAPVPTPAASPAPRPSRRIPQSAPAPRRLTRAEIDAMTPAQKVQRLTQLLKER